MAFTKFLWFFQIAPSFLKEHNFDENNWGELAEAGPWGTGAFKLVEGSNRLGRQSDRLVLEAYDRYWDRRFPKVSKIIFDNTLRDNREEAMRLCRETEGNVDIVSFIRPLDTLKVAESPFARVLKNKAPTVLGSTFNQRRANSKWRDVRLRKAVNYAINREELLKYAARGNAYNVEGFPIPPGAFGFDPTCPPAVYDPAKAKSLIAEAGYPNGFDVKIITLEAWKLEAKIISSMLGRVGLNAKVEILTLSEFFRKYFISFLDNPPEEQEWDFTIGFIADFFGHTAASFLNYGLLEDSHARWIEYDSKFEEMWKDIAQTVDSGAQEEKIRHIVHYLYDRAYDLTIYSPLLLYAVNKEVSFVPQKSYWLRFKETSVTGNHWSIRGKNN
jgi:peptide/nickel transport system substrate-binding protein